MFPVIHVDRLWKAFGENRVLDDVSLKILPGESVSIVGPSGCGKTVLAKHFNALLLPDFGRVTVYGIDTLEADETQLDEIRRKIGYVFQGNALFESAIASTVYMNVSLPLRGDPYDYPAQNEPQIEARAEQVLRQVGLGPEFFDRFPNQLSGGQQKRVAVARAVVANPPVVIYDEPTMGLDPQYAEILIELICQIHKDDGNTTLAITHDKQLMQRMERLIFLRNRTISFDGPTKDYFNSTDPVIMRFLASAPPTHSVAAVP